MGKKIAEEMAKQRSVFVEGATKRGVNEKKATYIFDLIDKFSGYGFNRSHSAGYALLAYQTAWLKAHYPAAFMAAVLSADMDNTDKVIPLIEECRTMKLKVLQPQINVSRYKFTIADDQNKSIHYGLGAIKGAGEAALESMITEREEKGSFADLFDFCRRIDLRKASRRVLEPLIKTGALDKLGPSRAVMMASLDGAIKSAERHSTDSAVGQNDIFSSGTKKPEEKSPFVKNVPEWEQAKRLNYEKECLGFYLSGHPITAYLPELAKLNCIRLIEVKPTNHKQTVRIAGWVTQMRMTTKHGGGRMAFVTLDDSSARMEIKIFSELYATVSHILTKDTLLIAEGEVRVDNYNGGYSMTANNLLTLETARENKALRLEITISALQAQPETFAPQLVATLTPHLQEKGHCQVLIHYQRRDAQVELTLGDKWRVKPETALIEKLEGVVGENKVKVIY